MKPIERSAGRPAMTAFVIWFAHFLLCWVAVEIWPFEVRANQLAWGFTALALLAMGLHVVRMERGVRRSADRGAMGADLAGFNHRFARRATAIATVAVLFTAFPSVVFLS
jgi:succinate dehydrogenase hydrophobic anchor subunit